MNEKKKFVLRKWHIIGVLFLLILIWWLFRPTPYDASQRLEGIAGQVITDFSSGGGKKLKFQLINQSEQAVSYKVHESSIEILRFDRWFKAPRLTVPFGLKDAVLVEPIPIPPGEEICPEKTYEGYIFLKGRYRVVIPCEWEDGTQWHVAFEFDVE